MLIYNYFKIQFKQKNNNINRGGNSLIFMLTAWYPNSKAREIGKKVLSLGKMPDFIKKWQVFATAAGDKGIKAYNLVMVEKGNGDEAAMFIVKMQQSFSEDIEGYVWKIETCLGVKDAFQALGMNT